MIQNRSLCERYHPNEVWKIVRKYDASSSVTCQNTFPSSNLVNNFAPCNRVVTSSIVSTRQRSRWITLLRYLGSKHIRSFPFFLVTMTMKLTQALGLLTSSIKSCFSRSSNAYFTCSISATCTQRCTCLTGSTVRITLMWCSPVNCPTPSPIIDEFFVRYRYRYMCLLLHIDSCPMSKVTVELGVPGMKVYKQS